MGEWFTKGSKHPYVICIKMAPNENRLSYGSGICLKKISSQFEAFRIIYLNIDKNLLHVRKETDYPEEFFL